MSLTARLHITGHSLEKQGIKINSLDFSFSQEVDNRGMAVGKVRQGLIYVTLPGIEDPQIIAWMKGNRVFKNFKIVFSGVVDTGKKRTIEFTDALCVYYREAFSDQSDVVVSLTLSARNIKIATEEFDLEWDLSADSGS